MPEAEVLEPQTPGPPPIDEPQSIADLSGAGASAVYPPAVGGGDGAPSLTDLLGKAMAPPDVATVGQFTDLKQREMDVYGRQQANNDRRFEEDRAQMKKAFSAENAMIGDTPKWDVASERQKYKTDPIESFGSFASVFAMVASAFTRAPMENALNGAAAAMNAKREGNEFEYNRSFDAWKANTDLAVKRFNMQHTALQDAFHIMDKDATRGNQKLLETMTKFGMEKELMLYQNGMVPEIMKAQESQLKMIEGVVRAQTEVSRMHDQERRTDIMAKRASMTAAEVATFDSTVAKLSQERAAAGLEPDPAADQQKALELVNKAKHSGQGANTGDSKTWAGQKAARLKELVAAQPDTPKEELIKQVSKEFEHGTPLSENQKIRIQEKADKVSSVTNQIERAMQLIREAGKNGASLTGATGALGTLKEFAVGQSSEHAEFTQLIRTVQQEIGPLLKGTTRLNAQDQKTIDVVVPGLGFLRNTQQVYEGLDKVLKILRKENLLDEEKPTTGNNAGELKPGQIVKQNGIRYQKQKDGSMKEIGE